MTTRHQRTPEEEAYGCLLSQKSEMLSEAARTVLGEAELAAHGATMVYNYCFQ
jgi:hypothetical protein